MDSVQSLAVQNSLGSMWPQGTTGNNFVENDTGVLMGIKLNMSQQWAQMPWQRKMAGCWVHQQ